MQGFFIYSKAKKPKALTLNLSRCNAHLAIESDYQRSVILASRSESHAQPT
jgi:hypothetical protein